MKSLYGKFILFTAGIMLISAVIAFLAVNTYYHQQLKEQNDAKNMLIAKNITSFIESSENINLEPFLTTQANVGYKILVVNNEKEVTFYGEDFRADNLSEQAINSVLNDNEYHGMLEFSRETFVTGFFSDETENTVGVPFHYNDETYALFLRPNIKLLFTEVHYLLGGMVLVMAIISLLAMIIVARKLIEPITKLTEATKEVGAEQFSPSLPTGRNDEIGQLATSFKTMTEKLKQSNVMRKQFINDVSHDFQTPLQNIKGYAELLSDEKVSLENRQKYTEIIQSETERLSSLTKQLLMLTTFDQLHAPIEKNRFQLDEQIKQVIRTHHWLIEQKQMTIAMEIESITMIGNEAFLEKVWENLLTNALKYTNREGTIDIILMAKKDQLIFTIQDSGIGISDEDIPYLFDRFFRVDEARHSKIEGTGLGLPIVKQVVELHDGKIDVNSKADFGTTITVTLPLIRNKE